MKKSLLFLFLFLMGCSQGKPFSRVSIGDKDDDNGGYDRPIGAKPSPQEEATAIKKMQGQWLYTECKEDIKKACKDIILSFSDNKFYAVTTYHLPSKAAGDINKVEMKSGNVRFVGLERGTKTYEASFDILASSNEKGRPTNLIKFYDGYLQINGINYHLHAKLDDSAASLRAETCPNLSGRWETDTENRYTHQPSCDLWGWNNDRESKFVIADRRWWRLVDKELWTRSYFTENALFVETKTAKSGSITKERHSLSSTPCQLKTAKEYYNFEVYEVGDKEPTECESFRPR